jgi:hypothetical protein
MKATGGEEPVCGEGEARTRGHRQSLIERRLDATRGEGLRPAQGRCAPLGVLRTRGRKRGFRGGGLRPWEGGGSRKFQWVFIGQGPMPPGEIQEKSKLMVASGLPR